MAESERGLNPTHLRQRFERAAAGFDGADFVHRHTANGLLERLAPVQLDVSRVLDAGSATGSASRELARRYRRSFVVSLDIAAGMLRRARRSRSRFARIAELQADALRLPLATGSVDLVFANLLLPSLTDIDAFFSGVARVLRKDGVFAFASLGPDSLRELREAWGTVDDGVHVSPFVDMHLLGDGMLRAGLREPVLDVDYLAVTYRDIDALFADLGAVGGRNSLAARRESLTGKGRLDALRQELSRRMAGGALELTFELVYGHAWGGGPAAPPGEFRVGLGDIGRRR